MALSKSDIAKEHVGRRMEATAKRFGIDVSLLIREDDLTSTVRQLNRMAVEQEASSQTQMVIPMLKGYLDTWPPLFDKLPQNLDKVERDELLFDIATIVYWRCYERCDFKFVRKTG